MRTRPNQLALGNYIDPRTFEEVRGIGFGSGLIMQISDEEFADRFPNLTEGSYENVVDLTRAQRDFTPVADKLLPLFDWCSGQETQWSVTVDLHSKQATFNFGFSNHRVAVDFKLRFYG